MLRTRPTFLRLGALLKKSCNRELTVPAGKSLTEEEVQLFKKHSFLLKKGFAKQQLAGLVQAAEDVRNFPKKENAYLQHWELNTVGKRVFCRAENFTPYHDTWGNFCSGEIMRAAGELFGEPVVLFKEKINYKQPGGNGFAAHQDSPAYIGMADDHISVMVALDDATAANGALEVAPGQWVKDQVKLNESGVVEDPDSMEWELVEAEAGDVLFFSGYIPHRSWPNKTDRQRRAVFLTYNPISQGEWHEKYYAAKHSQAHGFQSTHAISFQDDFQGKIVD